MESDSSDDIADDEAIFSIVLAAFEQILYDSESVSDTEIERMNGAIQKRVELLLHIPKQLKFPLSFLSPLWEYSV